MGKVQVVPFVTTVVLCICTALMLGGPGSCTVGA